LPSLFIPRLSFIGRTKPKEHKKLLSGSPAKLAGGISLSPAMLVANLLKAKPRFLDLHCTGF
jgi:hypothetical protein